jgi:hypothetical protein
MMATITLVQMIIIISRIIVTTAVNNNNNEMIIIVIIMIINIKITMIRYNNNNITMTEVTYLSPGRQCYPSAKHSAPLAWQHVQPP